MPLIRIPPEAFAGPGVRVLQAAEGVAGESGKSVRRVATDDDLGAARLAAQHVVPRCVERARADRARRREPRLRPRGPQHVPFLTRIDVEQNPRLAEQRLLDAGIEVQRAFRPQVASTAVNAEHLVEIGELTIDAAASTQTRPLRHTPLGVDPRGGRRRSGQAPMVDTAAGNHAHSRVHPEPHLCVRGTGRGLLVVVAERHQAARRRNLPDDAAAAAEMLDVAAEFDHRARRRRHRSVGAPSEVGEPRGVERRTGVVLVVEVQSGRVQPLGDGPPRARQVAPRQRRQPGAADTGLNVVDVELRIAFLEHRATEERRNRHLMARTEVVDRLALGVDEAEGESGLGIDPLDQIVEITAAHRGEPRSFPVGDRTLAEDVRTRPAQAGPPAELVAAALSGSEIDFGAELAAGTLRIASREQRHAAQRLAVDHGDRAAVAHVDRVHQVPRGHTVHDQADVAERVAAHRELAVEVVGRRGRRQRLDGPHRIVEHGAAQGLEFAAIERRPARDRIGLTAK